MMEDFDNLIKKVESEELKHARIEGINLQMQKKTLTERIQG
jgi:hypothetical protein